MRRLVSVGEMWEGYVLGFGVGLKVLFEVGGVKVLGER